MQKNVIEIAHRVLDIESEAIKNLKNNLSGTFEEAVNLILACQGRVVVCGMGKSGLVGRKIASTMASTGTPSFFLHPGEAFHGDLGMVTAQDLFIGISNSGETEEIIRLIPSIKRNGNRFIALCGFGLSTMARNADVFLNVGVKEEACPLQLAPTASTTAALAMGDALAVAAMEIKGFKSENFALFHPGGSLGRKLLTTVKDAMRSEKMPVVSPDTAFKELVICMTKGKLGLAIVMDEGCLAGIVTDGDLRRAWETHENLSDKKTSDIMNPHPKTVPPAMMLAEAETILLASKITALIVSPDGKQVDGVLQLYAV